MSLAINVSKEELLKGLAPIQNITGKKGTIAILSNVLIKSADEYIILTATDLEVGIKVVVPAEIVQPGSLTLPAKKLFEIVKESDADLIKIEEYEKHWANINANKSNYNLAGMDANEYPSFPEYDKDSLISVKSESIKELIDKTIFSVAQETENQFNLTGILVEKEMKENGSYLRMVSTDGHRLSVMEKEIDVNLSSVEIEKNTMIPKKGIMEIRKICDTVDFFEIGFEKKQTVIKTENSLLIIRLMNSDFPDYNNIINVINKERHFLIDRISFNNSLKRMSLFTEDRFNAVKFEINDKSLVMSSQSMDIGNAKDEIEIDYNGSTINLGFNGKYFIDTLQAMKSNEVMVFINSEESPCLITGEDDEGFISVIMPMKI